MSLFDTKEGKAGWGDDDEDPVAKADRMMKAATDDEKGAATPALSAAAPSFSFGAPAAAPAPATFAFAAPKPAPARSPSNQSATPSTGGSVDGLAATLSKQAVSVVETVKTAEGDTIQVHRADGASALVAARTWEELNLDPALLKGVYLANFAKPFKIQEAALPLILDGFKKTPHRENLLAQAKSGSGKTAAFALGMLQNVDLSKPHVQGLCVCPTRELATQNAAVVRLIGKTLCEEKGLVVALALSEGASRGSRGGRGRGARQEPIRGHIVVGTPGRTLQLIKARALDTRGVTMLVLDEADEMDARGHRDDTRSLRKALPDACQVMCFSATYTDEVVRDIETSVFMRHPSSKVLIAATDDDRSALMVREIAHVWCDCKEHPNGKIGIVEDIYDLLSAQQSIIFVNTRKDVSAIASVLKAKSFSVEDLTGGKMDAMVRDRVMAAFRDGKVKVLITTNVIARGIDVPGVNIVINYDLPVIIDYSQPRGAGPPPEPDSDTYIHRVGRTGRAGARGVAINLVDSTDGRDMACLASLETKCFGRQPAPWTMIQKVPDASDIEAIKDMVRKKMAEGK